MIAISSFDEKKKFLILEISKEFKNLLNKLVYLYRISQRNDSILYKNQNLSQFLISIKENMTMLMNIYDSKE